MPPRRRAALAGYYGFGNLGDELLLRASVEMFERCGVGRDELVILSNDPEASSKEFGVEAVSRWGIGGLIRTLSSCETMLLGGGGLFQDSTSARSCVWYWGLVRLARLCGCRVWAAGQSLGPLRGRISRLLTADALRACSAVHLRDAPSAELAGRLGVDAREGSDMALTLDVPELPYRPRDSMLVNLRPGGDDFVDALSDMTSAFGGRVIGAAMSAEDEDILRSYAERLRLSETVRVRSLDEAASIWSRAARAVGMRLHFAVLSSLFHTPLSVLSYDPKTSAFADAADVPCVSGSDLRISEPRLPSLPSDCLSVRAELDAVCRSVLGIAK